jgi:ribosomal protein L11
MQRRLRKVQQPNRVSVGSITKAQLEEIANIKLPDLNTTKVSYENR